MKPLACTLAVAAGLWMVMFSPSMRGSVNFWAAMSFSAGGLTAAAIALQRKHLGELFAFRPAYPLVGMISAGVLYLVFLAGHLASTAMTGFAAGQVMRIYDLKASAPTAVIVLVLLLIAPAEEIFWRGFVQVRLAGRLGRWPGMLSAAAAYTLVHAWAGNAMLLAAAAVCGVFWGCMMLRFRSLWPGIISHVVWDLGVFVVLPIGAG